MNRPSDADDNRAAAAAAASNDGNVYGGGNCNLYFSLPCTFCWDVSIYVYIHAVSQFIDSVGERVDV